MASGHVNRTPVATHLIDSLAHPGGNITGISDNAAALATKRLALIKQAVPAVRRIAMLWNRNDLGMSMRYDASADAARSLGTRRRGDRVAIPIAALHESAYGTKRTFSD
jgi:ABC-type uncharacterized transport system substrate-binding protein